LVVYAAFLSAISIAGGTTILHLGIAGSNPLAPTNPPQCPTPTLTLAAFSRRVERLSEIEAAPVPGEKTPQDARSVSGQLGLLRLQCR
jgi:hypothetical protein